MPTPIAIAGGNIAGLSAAYFLARRGFDTTVYETRLWNKPCGGAISREFAQYLEDELDITPYGADHVIPGITMAFCKNRSLNFEGFFVVTSRYELQKQLIARLSREPNIRIIYKRVSLKDHALFTPQTIIATGFSGFTRQVMGHHWHRMEKGLSFRFDGEIDTRDLPDRHLIVFDSRIGGYAWIFLGKGRHINIGIGGRIDRCRLKKWYTDSFFQVAGQYGYRFPSGTFPLQGWKIPVAAHNWRHPVSFLKNGIEFIGTGDVLGLAHPIMGAGIEPAWQSGWLLAESVDARTGRIDTNAYRNLLKHNLKLTCRKPFDRLMVRVRNRCILSFKDFAAYLSARFGTRHMLNRLQKYPWFAMVHDGTKKTGFSVSLVPRK